MKFSFKTLCLIFFTIQDLKILAKENAILLSYQSNKSLALKVQSYLMSQYLIPIDLIEVASLKDNCLLDHKNSHYLEVCILDKDGEDEVKIAYADSVWIQRTLKVFYNNGAGRRFNAESTND